MFSRLRFGLFARFLSVSIPVFFGLVALGLMALERPLVREDSMDLAARVGSQAARTAASLARYSAAANPELAQDLIAPMAVDRAVRCIEFRAPGQQVPVATWPPRVGCTGQTPEQVLRLEVGEQDPAELRVVFSEAEVVQAQNLRRQVALLVVGASFVIAVVSAGIGFRLIISGPMARLRAAMHRSTETGERTLVVQAPNDEIGDIIHTYNQLTERENIREASLVKAHHDLVVSEETLRGMNFELERHVDERTAELLQAKLRAEEADRAKTRFLANMSHELRTPLNAVIGSAQLLALEEHDAESREQLIETIRKSGINLLGLIENVLDLSRIEAGAMRLVNEEFDLGECIEPALATANVAAAAKGVALRCEFEPDLPRRRCGDAARIRQVVLNLLGNAVKFTPAGEVLLHLRRGDADDQVHLRLADTGVGISAASLPHIFDAFRQADDAANRRFGGSGLGLSIVRELVHAMGGRIEVSSELDRGTVFEIDLPLPVAAVAEAGAAAVQAPQTASPQAVPAGDVPGSDAPQGGKAGAADPGLRPTAHEAGPPPTPLPAAPPHVLVVEDDPMNQAIVCRLLKHAGCSVAAADGGGAALQMLREQRFDLVLMDWQMPDMDGLEATRRIRGGQAGADAQLTPIVALTANAFAEDRDACLEAGMDDFLTKPVLADRLKAAVQRWAHRGARHGDSLPNVIAAPDAAQPVTAPRDTGAASEGASVPVVKPRIDGQTAAAGGGGRHAAGDSSKAAVGGPVGATAQKSFGTLDRGDVRPLRLPPHGGEVDALLEAFIATGGEVIKGIETCLAGGQSWALGRRVQALQATAAQVGATALAAEAARQAADLRAGHPPDPAGPTRLRGELAAFSRDLAARREALSCA